MPIKWYKKRTNQHGKSYYFTFITRCLLLSFCQVSLAIEDTGKLSEPETRACNFLTSAQPNISEAMIFVGQDRSHVEYWSQNNRLGSLTRELQRLIFDGLPVARYRLDDLIRARQELGDRGNLDTCDAFLASQSYLMALDDLYYGKLRPRELGLVWYAPETQITRSAITLQELAKVGESDIRAAFGAARPSLPRYQNLRNAYRMALRNLPDSWPELPAGPTLKEGDISPRVPLLRQRLKAQGYVFSEPGAELNPEQFDIDLALAVSKFQRDHNLEDDGVPGRKTYHQLQIPPAARLAEIRANLERLRWLARDSEPTMVLADITGTAIELYRDGELVWSGKSQVGKPQRPAS